MRRWRSVTGSISPSYKHLLRDPLNVAFSSSQFQIDMMSKSSTICCSCHVYASFRGFSEVLNQPVVSARPWHTPKVRTALRSRQAHDWVGISLQTQHRSANMESNATECSPSYFNFTKIGTPFQGFPVRHGNHSFQDVWLRAKHTSSKQVTETKEGCDLKRLSQDIETFAKSAVKQRNAQNHFVTHFMERLRRVLQKSLKHCTVELFGSRACGLSLPWSDLDVIVTTSEYPMSTSPRTPHLSKLLRRTRDLVTVNNLCEPGSLLMIATASVPILKMRAVGSDLSCDVSFARVEPPPEYGFLRSLPNHQNPRNSDPGHRVQEGSMVCIKGKLRAHGGAATAEWSLEQQAEFPHVLLPLMLVLKTLLCQTKLHDPSQGGLGGYALLNMLVAFLRQQEAKGTSTQKDDLGRLLVGFLHKYGHEYEYDRMCISLEENDTTGEIRKEAAWWIPQRKQLPKQMQLHIQDPVCPGNNISKSTGNVVGLKSMFASAHDALLGQASSFGYGASKKRGTGTKSLGRIIDTDSLTPIEGKSEAYSTQKKQPSSSSRTNTESLSRHPKKRKRLQPALENGFMTASA